MYIYDDIKQHFHAMLKAWKLGGRTYHTVKYCGTSTMHNDIISTTSLFSNIFFTSILLHQWCLFSTKRVQFSCTSIHVCHNIGHSRNMQIGPDDCLLRLCNDSFTCQWLPFAPMAKPHTTLFVMIQARWTVLPFICANMHCWMNAPWLHYWYFTDLPEGWLSPTNHTLTLVFCSSTTFVTVIASWRTWKKTKMPQYTPCSTEIY